MTATERAIAAAAALAAATEERDRAMEAMRAEGASYEKVAAAVGMTPMGARNLLLRRAGKIPAKS